ncbi:MAG: thioredoxin family protein [Thermoanaerobaculia bacterium]|nr:thioredoxin family protein [Thermoanaerobaculia bacterium]
MSPRKLSVLSLGLSLGLSPGFASAAVSAPPAEPQKKEAQKMGVQQAAPIFDSDAIGQRQVADYQKVAKDSGRRLLLIFGTNECAPCRAFNRAIHEKLFFKAFINQFVPVYVDVSSGTNASLLVDYNVNPAAEQPGVVILMPDARILEVLAQGEMAALARKGDAAVQEFFLARFLKTEK